MNTLKHNNMTAAYTGHKGPVTVKAIKDQIPEELFDRLTGHELGIVMNAVNAAYHNGKASAGAEVIDGEVVWVNSINRGFEISRLRDLPKETWEAQQ